MDRQFTHIYKIVSFLALMLVFKAQSIAQPSTTNGFTAPLVIYNVGVDTNFQYFDEIITIQDQINRVNKYLPFTNSDYPQCYNQIDLLSNQQTFLSSLHFSGYVSWAGASNFYFPYKNKFKLNADTCEYFYYLNPKVGLSDVAFVIVPGSGYNEGVQIAIQQPADYHNTPCVIAKELSNFGDVYTYVKPLNDFCSYWAKVPSFGRLGMNYERLLKLSDSLGHNYNANAYIQIMALVKSLKAKYSKVVVLGLSAGSWGALFTSLQSEPDACIAASGYSILFDNLNWNTNSASQLYFNGLFTQFPKDSVREIVKRQDTKYLFSYGDNDQIAIIDSEYTFKLTQNFLNDSVALNNSKFYYNFTDHVFPCDTLFDFVDYAIKVPKAKLSLLSTCNSDSATIKISFSGIPPFTFDIYVNDTFRNTYSCSTNLFILNSKKFGKHTVKNLTNLTLEPGFKSNELFVNKRDPFYGSAKLIDSADLCKQTSINLEIKGNKSPFYYSLYDSITSQITTYSFTDSVNILTLPRHSYFENKLNDSFDCQISLNNSKYINIDKLNLQSITPNFICDSNAYNVKFELLGDAPFEIQYLKNGISESRILDSVVTYVYLSPGVYKFTSLADRFNCTIPLVDSFELGSYPFSVLASEPIFQCDSSAYYQEIALSGRDSFLLDYTFNGNPQKDTFLTGINTKKIQFGNYIYQTITDANNCIYNFNFQKLFVQEDPVDAIFSNGVYNCDSFKTKIEITFSGYAPYVLKYKLNNVDQTYISNNKANTLYLENGNYLFEEMVDSINCKKYLNYSLLLDFNPISQFSSSPVYNCANDIVIQEVLLNGNNPIIMHYQLNGSTQILNLAKGYNTLSFGNGMYTFDSITDVTGCFAPINTMYNFNYHSLSTTLSQPVFVCDSNKTKISFTITGNPPYTIKYLQNGILQEFETNNNAIDKFFENGDYEFISIEDSTDCIFQINKIFNINFATLSASISSPFYNCDSNKTQLSFSLNGNAPFSIQYLDNGINKEFQSGTNSLTEFIANGTYQFFTVTDSTGCIDAVNKSYQFNFHPINAVISNAQYNCDSNKTAIDFVINGNQPYLINYTENALPKLFSSQVDSFNLFVENGQYHFIEVTDSTGCNIVLQDTFQFNYSPINVTVSSPVFDCDSLKNKVVINSTGNYPIISEYIQDGFNQQLILSNSAKTIFLENGAYIFTQSLDSTNCLYVNQTPMALNDSAITFSIKKKKYNCVTNQTDVEFAIGGKAPYTINYLKNTIPISKIEVTNNPTWLLDNGLYQILNITDANGCILSIGNLNIFVDNKVINSTIVSNNFDCNTNSYFLNLQLGGELPIQLNYQKNGIVDSVISNTANLTMNFPNGNFTLLHMKDNNKCYKTINQSLSLLDSIPYFTLKKVYYNCSSNSNIIPFELKGNPPFILNYTINNLVFAKLITTYTDSLDIAAGSVRLISVSNATGCTLNLADSFQLKSTPVSLQVNKTYYSCLTDKTIIELQNSGLAPYIINYKSNQTALQENVNANNFSISFPNGIANIISITDSNSCFYQLDTTFVFNEKPLKLVWEKYPFNCSKQSTQIQIAMQGKPNYVLDCKIDNIDSTYIISDSILNLYFKSNLVEIVKITDSNKCEIINNVLIDAIVDTFENRDINYSNFVLSLKNLNVVKYNWYLNDVLVSENNFNEIKYQGNGTYIIEALMPNGCIYKSNPLIVSEQSIILYPNPVQKEFVLIYNELLKQNTPAYLYDVYSKKVKEFSVKSGINNFSMEGLAAGTYYLQVQPKENADKLITLRIVKMNP